MRLGTYVPKVGDYWLWDIEEIMERSTGDIRSETDTGFCGCDGCIEDGCEEDSLGGKWDRLLEDKRYDEHYDAVVESIAEHGFVCPLTARVVDGVVELGDGHHRLAAARDLNIWAVPVLMMPQYDFISADSFDWGECAEPPTPGFIQTRDNATYPVPTEFTLTEESIR